MSRAFTAKSLYVWRTTSNTRLWGRKWHRVHVTVSAMLVFLVVWSHLLNWCAKIVLVVEISRLHRLQGNASPHKSLRLWRFLCLCLSIAVVSSCLLAWFESLRLLGFSNFEVQYHRALVPVAGWPQTCCEMWTRCSAKGSLYVVFQQLGGSLHVLCWSWGTGLGGTRSTECWTSHSDHPIRSAQWTARDQWTRVHWHPITNVRWHFILAVVTPHSVDRIALHRKKKGMKFPNLVYLPEKGGSKMDQQDNLRDSWPKQQSQTRMGDSDAENALPDGSDLRRGLLNAVQKTNTHYLGRDGAAIETHMLSIRLLYKV